MNSKKFFTEWVMPIGFAVILVLLIDKFLFFQVSVPTKSMYPTIKPGDRIIVSRVYKKEKLQRGDIVVFYSKELDKTLIKRLVGLPGDSVVVDIDGKVHINGKESDEPYVVYNGGKTGEYKVPKGSYFFLGDNRGNSWDARYWNQTYISEDDIKGKAQFIIFPFSRAGKFKVGEAAEK